MKLLLDVLQKKERVETPIWLMRQAGRYLPEYRDIRKKAGSFLNLCYNPTFATDVTIQPIARFDFDAAIIFSDILVVPDILGLNVDFIEGVGPQLDIIKDESELKKLKVSTLQFSDKMQKVCEAISKVKSKLDSTKALIGFAGSPWTVATYMLSNKRHDFDYLRTISLEKTTLLTSLINILIDQTVIYLIAQIDAGADLLQIFDSWAGILTEEEYRRFVIEPNRKIVTEVKKLYPNIPIIGFPKGSGILYEEYINNVNVDAVSLDYCVPLSYAKKLQQKIVVQGNLDPMVLLTGKDIIERKIDAIMSELGSTNFIFNLGHGINKETKIENVSLLVDFV